MKLLSLLCSVLLLFSFTEKENPKSELTLRVEGIRTIEGKLAVLVFDEEIGFPDDKNNAILELTVDVTSKEMDINLGNLPHGKYAIAIIHDKNSNKELDKNVLGIPKEPFGFTNTEKVYFGPPSFSEASFLLNEVSNKAKVRLLEI